MRFALSNNERIEPTKRARGVCPCCGSELVARCGEIKRHHWSHKKKCDDHWWENETDWHRNWKNQFPHEWQEIIQYDESGEKHIADVKTSAGWTIEFQHSPISKEERDSRDYFYNKLIWIVDGTRRPTDVKQFQNLLNEAEFVSNSDGQVSLKMKTGKIFKVPLNKLSKADQDFITAISSSIPQKEKPKTGKYVPPEGALNDDPAAGQLDLRGRLYYKKGSDTPWSYWCYLRESS